MSGTKRYGIDLRKIGERTSMVPGKRPAPNAERLSSTGSDTRLSPSMVANDRHKTH